MGYGQLDIWAFVFPAWSRIPLATPALLYCLLQSVTSPFTERGKFMKGFTQLFWFLRQLRPAGIHFIRCNTLYFIRFLYSSENWLLRGLRVRVQIMIVIYHCQKEIKQILVRTYLSEKKPSLPQHIDEKKAQSYKDFLNSIDSLLLISSMTFLSALDTCFDLLLISL